MSMWDVLASDYSSDDDSDDNSSSSSSSSSGGGSCGRESPVGAAIDVGMVEDLLQGGVAPDVMDAVSLPHMMRTPSSREFRRSKKRKEKMMRRRTRDLHNSFAALATATTSTAGPIGSGAAPTGGSSGTDESSCSSSGTGAGEVVRKLSQRTAASAAVVANYHQDLSVNCAYLLTSDAFGAVPLCEDHRGAFDSWAEAVLRDSSFEEVANTINQHRARVAAASASPPRKEDPTGLRAERPFDAWVAEEKARRAEAKRAAENTLVVYNTQNERMSVSEQAAVTPLLDNALAEGLAFPLKADCNGCCACSSSALPKKRGRPGTADAVTTTSFPFLGAYACHRLVFLLKGRLKKLCKKHGSARRYRPTTAGAGAGGGGAGGSGHRRHRGRKQRKRHPKSRRAHQRHEQAERRWRSSSSGSTSSDDGSAAVSAFFVDATGQAVVVTDDNQQHNHQQDRVVVVVAPPATTNNDTTTTTTNNNNNNNNHNSGRTDMWGVSFESVFAPPESEAEVAAQAAAAAVQPSHTCAVCMEVLCHPCSLRRCGHIFCRGCLLSMLHGAAQVRIVA